MNGPGSLRLKVASVIRPMDEKKPLACSGSSGSGVASAKARLRHRLQFTVQRAEVLGNQLQFGQGVLLGHARHDGVVAADLRVLVGLVSLQCDVEVVAVLTGELGVAGVDRLVVVFTVAGGAIGLFSNSATWGDGSLGLSAGALVLPLPLPS